MQTNSTQKVKEVWQSSEGWPPMEQRRKVWHNGEIQQISRQHRYMLYIIDFMNLWDLYISLFSTLSCKRGGHPILRLTARLPSQKGCIHSSSPKHSHIFTSIRNYYFKSYSIWEVKNDMLIYKEFFHVWFCLPKQFLNVTLLPLWKQKNVESRKNQSHSFKRITYLNNSSDKCTNTAQATVATGLHSRNCFPWTPSRGTEYLLPCALHSIIAAKNQTSL